ncbi:MAG TPA: type IX secretion system membrane protein PorP/SprF [Bacteroidetes bacterium]|nr:type IX secretion system membrane protein PorP/SprF [Bacteroidota bacterium]
MKNIFLLIATLFVINTARSQEQSAVFSHYFLSPILVNPSVAGFNEMHQLQMNIRSQWTGFPESPKSYHIGYNGPIGKTLGIGFGIMSENLGNRSNLRFQMNYAFRYELENVKFAAGFSTEFHTLKLASSVKDNPYYESGDPLIEDAIEGNKLFDASLGFWTTFYNNTYIGLSFSNLVVAKIGQIESGDPQGEFFKFVTFNFGHTFDIEEYNFKLTPSLMIHRIKDTPFRVDFNIMGSFIDDKLIAGLSYQAGLGGDVGLLLGTNVDVFRIYYSYDVSFQTVQKYNGGTHEVTVAFDFGKGKKKFDRG